MNTPATHLASALAGLVAVVPALAQDTTDGTDTFPFSAHLSGAQEVTPPAAPTTPSLGVVSTATGDFTMEVSQDLSSINFTLTAAITGATQAHLHCGRAGENGPVVAPLIEPVDAGVNATDSTPLGEGTITNEDLAATAEGCAALIGRPVRNVASLADAALHGLIYANVHTVTNPEGEIRGQLISGGASTSTPPSGQARH